ncbi:MAG: bi-domain-containing oxidoreductase [Pseudomonadales bacterium]
MKQILQDLQSGETLVTEVPTPTAVSNGVLVRTSRTLVSAGTERMLVDFGRGNLLQKAKQQPDKVKQVLEKVHTDGVLPTLDAVRNKLSTPLALGYCNVGVVVESRCAEFNPGERVVSNGKHSEFVAVPKNLAALIPESVDDESAAFTVIAAIALQGIRLLKPTLGETVVVTGLGLIGLVAVQLLRAHGCRVLGIDFDPEKIALAKQFGAETVDLSQGQDPLVAADQYSRGRGVDAVLITASTKSNEPIHQAATMCRKRGRIVLVGVVGMEMSRADFYEKELSFQVSCSYGPGRYDPEYEEKGSDYPVGFVRWTEQRNFEAVLDMMADGRIDMRPLISHRFRLEQAAEAYELISSGTPLGVLLEYETADAGEPQRTVVLNQSREVAASPVPCLGFIGAGNYASSVLVPALARTGARVKSIASSTGVSSVHVGRKNGVENATTDAQALLTDPDIDALVVTTRHNSHAHWIIQSLQSGKHVFVEKPVALSRSELEEIANAYATCGAKSILMVGFNRRYSPLSIALKQALEKLQQPAAFSMTVNAGQIPADHWTQDPAIGGGRIIGEACHFVDLLRFLAASPINAVNSLALRSRSKDSLTIQLAFENGSIGTIDYLANGNKAFPKERLEVFCGGGIARIDNFRALKSIGWPGLKSQRLLRQDKGQLECSKCFVDAIGSGDTSRLIPFEEISEVANICFDIVEQIH